MNHNNQKEHKNLAPQKLAVIQQLYLCSNIKCLCVIDFISPLAQSYPLVTVGHNMVSVSMGTSMAAAGGSTLTSTVKDKTVTAASPSLTVPLVAFQPMWQAWE